MTARTSYCAIASLLVVALGVGTASVAYYVGLPGGALAAQSAPSELRLVPATATLVAYADVHEIVASNFREQLRQLFPVRAEGRQDFEAATGINIDADIDHVVGYVTTEVGADGDRSGALIARGRFDQSRVESLMRAQGATVSEYRGRRLIVGGPTAPLSGAVLSPERRQDSDLSVAFLETGLLVAGSALRVRSTLDLHEGGDSITTNGQMMNMIAPLDGGNFWIAGRFDALTNQATVPERFAGQLPPITWFSLSGRVNGGVLGEFRAETGDAEAARSLRELAQGLIAFGRLQVREHPALEGALHSLQLGGTGTTVTLGFDIPAAALVLLRPAGSPPAR
jgi:hypothetical protein